MLRRVDREQLARRVDDEGDKQLLICQRERGKGSERDAIESVKLTLESTRDICGRGVKELTLSDQTKW